MIITFSRIITLVLLILFLSKYQPLLLRRLLIFWLNMMVTDCHFSANGTIRKKLHLMTDSSLLALLNSIQMNCFAAEKPVRTIVMQGTFEQPHTYRQISTKKLLAVWNSLFSSRIRTSGFLNSFNRLHTAYENEF